jgi:hypothetical protein
VAVARARAYLALWFGVGLFFAQRTFTRKLVL